MSRRPNPVPYLAAGAAVGLGSAIMVAVSLFRLIWAMVGLVASLVRLAYLTVFDRPGRS